MVMTMMMAFAKSFTVPSPKHFHLLLHFSLLVALWGMQDWLASQVFIYIYIYFIFLGPQNTMFTKIHQARILLILPRAFAPVWCLCCWCWAVKQSGPEAQSSMPETPFGFPLSFLRVAVCPAMRHSWTHPHGVDRMVWEVKWERSVRRGGEVSLHPVHFEMWIEWFEKRSRRGQWGGVVRWVSMQYISNHLVLSFKYHCFPLEWKLYEGKFLYYSLLIPDSQNSTWHVENSKHFGWMDAK